MDWEHNSLLELAHSGVHVIINGVFISGDLQCSCWVSSNEYKIGPIFPPLILQSPSLERTLSNCPSTQKPMDYQIGSC